MLNNICSETLDTQAYIRSSCFLSNCLWYAAHVHYIKQQVPPLFMLPLLLQSLLAREGCRSSLVLVVVVVATAYRS